MIYVAEPGRRLRSLLCYTVLNMRPGPHWANAVFIETAALWLDHDILSLQQLNLWHGTGPGWSKGAFIAGWLLPLPCLNTKALFLFQFYSWLPPHLEWLPSRAPQSSLRVESCLVFYQVLQRPDCVPFSSGYNVGLFQEVAEPSGNRLPSGPSHQPRHRELWTLEWIAAETPLHMHGSWALVLK